MFERLLTGVCLAAVSCLLAACPASRQGPPLPDIGDPVERVDRRTVRLQHIHAVMRRDLEQLEALQTRLADAPDGLFAAPFPGDLFRHVAMRCLSTTSGESAPSSSASPSTSPTSASSSDNLDCQPRFEERLYAELDERTPDRRTRARELLRGVDRFQSLRGQLRRRIARIDEIIAQTREILANQRADLATRREKLASNRAEYAPSRWNKARGMLEAYRNALNKLEHAANALDSDDDGWPQRVEAINEAMYFAISERWGG